MHCYHCGCEIPEDLKFCPQCGNSVEEQETLFAEEPQVEEVPSAELFEEETEEAVPAINDDVAFELDVPVEEETEEIEEAEEVAEEDDATLDPTSPEFDPRKFAGLDHEEFRPLSASELLEEEDAAEEPKAEKKKGRAGITLLIIALVLVLVGAVGGLLFWLTQPNKELVVEDNFMEFMQLDDDTAVTEFVIDNRETNRLKLSDTVWCSVTLEDGAVHAEQDYVMNYRLTREGWKLSTVDERNTETWVMAPMAGAPAETVSELLVGQQIEMDDTYSYTLTAEDVANAEVLSQDTDLAAGTDVVTVAVSVVDELVGWTAEAELVLAFADGWTLREFTHSEPEIEFKPGMEFELTEEDYLDVLAANPMTLGEDTDTVKTTVVTDGEADEEKPSLAQTVKLSKNSISDLKVLETSFDLEENVQTVVVEFMLDKQVAKLQVEAALSYVFEDGWKIDAVEYIPVVKEVVLDGTWVGVYPELDGRIPGVTMTVGKNADGTDNNVFSFGPSETNPYFFTGKYYVELAVDAETLEVSVNATDWVLYYNPGGVAMVDLKGVLMLDDAVITDGQDFRIALEREAVTEEEAVNEEAVAQTVVTNAVSDRVVEKPAEEAEKTEDETAEEVTEETTEEVTEEETKEEETVIPEDEGLGENDTPIG